MSSLHKRILFSLGAGLLVGAVVAGLSSGAPFLTGWLAASLLSISAIFCLAWAAAGGGRRLAWMVALAFGLRLGLGILLSLGLQTFGYDEPVNKAGYIYADAFTRDNDAWDLAQSGRPILSSFSQEIVSDQYGGALAMGAAVYRYLSPDAHRRFLILILSAFTAALGVPFFWKAVRRRWNEPLANLATWLVVLYPESLLLGGSQLREPYLIGLGCIALWAVLGWRQQGRASLPLQRDRAAALGGGLSLAVMTLFSWRAAAVFAAMLAVIAWLEFMEELSDRKRALGWGILGAVGVLAALLSWTWITGAGKFEATNFYNQTGMGQAIVRQLGKELVVPFFTAYGLAQPVLPAVLVDPAAWIWQVIGVLRAAGWYLLAPFLLYAIFAAWKASPGRDRRLLAGMAVGVAAWIVICSLRAGGDQWDNPRYRTIFLPFMAMLVSWGWLWARQKKDLWVWGWVAADAIFSLSFTAWYVLRVTGSSWKPPFLVMVPLIVALVALVGGGLWAWSWRRDRLAAGEPADLRAEGRRFLARRTPPVSPPGKRTNRWDWLAAATFLAFALLYLLGRLQGNYPITLLGGDAGNIASYAAALDHPDWFRLDPVLGSLNNIGIYATLHLPLIRALAPLSGGDYGLAYTWLLLPTIFGQLLGFYLLGRALFKNRWWAYLLAWITAMMVIDIGLGEVWGLWRDALPRVTFQALLPYLLALAVIWRGQPRRWPWLMLGAGVLVYAHPVSAPPWGFALWLGLWLNLPVEWKPARRLGVMLGLGLLFLLPMVPFAINYLSYRGGGGASYATLMPLMLKYFPENLLNVPAAVWEFIKAMSKNLLIPLGGIGIWGAWVLGKQERPLVKLVLAWGVGICVVGILVPFGERTLENIFHILPLETELLRSIRYLVPLLLVFWLWPLALLAPRLALPQARRAALGLGIALAGFWSITHLPDASRLLSAATCLARGQLVCETQRAQDEVIAALRSQTPSGAGIFAFDQDERFTSNSLSVRYSALRPLVYSVRDQGILGYAQPAALPAWDGLTEQVNALRLEPDPQARLAKLLPVALSLQASYIVIDFQVPPEGLSQLPVRVVMQNEGYMVLAVK